MCTDLDYVLICAEPTTSVPFDGNIPTLTGLDGDMWASQLLTLDAENNPLSDVRQTLYFRNKPDSLNVLRVEVVLFNCPEWGISVESIEILDGLSGSTHATMFPNTTSCSSLV